MKEGKELYKKAELPAGLHADPCPVCGADAEFWQYSKDFKNGPIDKLIMCSNGDHFGPQDGAGNEGCLLYMPPQDFYRGRISEAVKFWNQYARALNAQRHERHLERAKELRQVMAASKVITPKKEFCNYPHCNCPFDAPADPNWCARGLPHNAGSNGPSA